MQDIEAKLWKCHFYLFFVDDEITSISWSSDFLPTLIFFFFSFFFSPQADTTHPLTKHRKIASSFRDSSLFDIFTLSCNLLKQVCFVLSAVSPIQAYIYTAFHFCTDFPLLVF